MRSIRISEVGNCLFLCAWGWGIVQQERKQIANPRGYVAYVAWPLVRAHLARVFAASPLSRAPNRTAMLRRLGVCRGGMVTGQIEQCITHQCSFMGIYSTNLVLYVKKEQSMSYSHLIAAKKTLWNSSPPASPELKFSIRTSELRNSKNTDNP